MKVLSRLILCAVLAFVFLPGNVRANTPDRLLFSDNFDARTNGELSGQNGWTSAGGSSWTVTAASPGKNVVGGDSSVETSAITQTGYSLKNVRVVGDSKAVDSTIGMYLWARRSGSSSSANGYTFFRYSDGKFYLFFVNGGSYTGLGTPVSVSLANNALYTMEMEVTNDGFGNPYIRAWVYLQGNSRPTVPTFTYLDTDKNAPNAGYAGFGAGGTSVTVDNLSIYSGDEGTPDVAESGTQATPALVATTYAAGPTSTTTRSINTTGASLLVATVSTYGISASAVVLTDSRGNTWHALEDRVGSANVHTAIWYAYDKSGSTLDTSATHTLTITSSDTIYTGVVFSAFSGTMTSGNPYHVQNGSGGSSTSLSTGSVTSTSDNELAITSFGADVAGNYSINNSYTLVKSLSLEAGINMGNAQAYLVKASAGATNPTWTSTASANIATEIAFFRAAGNSGPTIPGTPGSLAANASSSRQIGLSWTAPSSGGSSITDYLIEYRTGVNAYAPFNDGISTVPSVTVTGLSAGIGYDFKVSAINAVGTSSAATVTATTSATAIHITSPSRAISASSTVATLAIPRTECSTTFYIPYIQSSTTISVSASVEAASLPAGGGVKFVLTDSHSNASTSYDLSSPFTATFTGLSKSEYTLETYIVDSNQAVQGGAVNYDTATKIGVGDIFVAIGDSVTEGYDGTAYNVSPYTDWTQAPVRSNDARNYPQCGLSSGFYQDHWQEVSHHISLNNKLEAFYGYPVFILNEGVAGITTSGYSTKIGTAAWQNPVNLLRPNKWLVHLGINDGGGSSGFQTQMQTLLNTLTTSYFAASSSIMLAVPSTQSSWQPYINNLISTNNLFRGPDFNTFYANNTSPTLYVGVHPNVAGHVEMGRLWGISLMSPKNVAVSQNGTAINISWDNLSTIEPSIAGYRLSYGTSPTALTTIVDVGNTTSRSVTSGLSNGQTYYFAVQGYDNDAFAVNRTGTSTPVSVTYTLDTTPPVISSISSGTPGSNSATITWTTNEAADSKVIYGVSPGIYIATTTSASLSTSHSISLSNLSAVITYYYRVISADASGNTATSSESSFTTAAVAVATTRGGTSSSGSVATSGLASLIPGIVLANPISNPTTNAIPSSVKVSIIKISPNGFTSVLSPESQNNQVKALQTLLSNIPGIYPTKQVTGFYGPLTKQAIQRFQMLYKIVSSEKDPGYGIVGPKTRAALNKLLKN